MRGIVATNASRSIINSHLKPVASPRSPTTPINTTSVFLSNFRRENSTPAPLEDPPISVRKPVELNVINRQNVSEVPPKIRERDKFRRTRSSRRDKSEEQPKQALNEEQKQQLLVEILGMATPEELEDIKGMRENTNQNQEHLFSIQSEDVKQPKKIWERSMRGLKRQDITSDVMRKLFRLLDQDGSGELSAHEIQFGLTSMGFEILSNPAILMKVMTTMDARQAQGCKIDEAEFLSFFSNKSRRDMDAILASEKSSTSIRGLSFNSSGECRDETWPSSLSHITMKLEHLVTVTSKQLSGSDVELHWLDITGFDDKTFNALAGSLNMSKKELRDLLLFQDPSVEPLKSNNSIIKFNIHFGFLSPKPFIINTSKNDCCNCFHSKKIQRTTSRLAQARLCNKHATNRICISQSQLTMLLINNRLLVTLRCLQSESLLLHVDDFWRKLCLPTSNPDRESLSHVFSSTVHAAVMELLGLSVQSFFLVRDDLEDWAEVTKYSIRQRQSHLHSLHLEFLESTYQDLEKAIRLTYAPLDHIAGPQYACNEATKATSSQVDEEARAIVRKVIGNDLDDVIELSGFLKRLVSSIPIKLANIEKLDMTNRNAKQDRLNLVMYALTLVTVFTIPMGFFTGLFGMNFSDMSFLESESDYGLGHNLIWVCLAASWLLLGIFMLGKGMFEPLRD
jgi:Mg2+ and Co2+ transporter CorA